ncbi:uncharacterized protein LOC119362618 [Triticum dicoccoides]|uniref:uncharacterized protein LOC119362618 n=1 Tax=Triticum dicoccoides TaxID=85692 RepID=UPI00188FF2DD|nr:uncharacterized protein LOC119362618 [Triticum dicoccoides]
MASSPASCFFSVALLARLQHQSLQLSLSAPMTLSYSKQEVGQGSCPLKADRKEEGSASSSQGGTPEPWCRGGWRRDWRRRCGWYSLAGSSSASPSPAMSRMRSEAAISPSKAGSQDRLCAYKVAVHWACRKKIDLQQCNQSVSSSMRE